MAVHEIDSPVDQPMGEADLVPGHLVTPVAAPVDRCDHDIAGAPEPVDALEDLAGSRIREVVQDIDPGTVRGGSPFGGNPARLGSEGEHEHPSSARQIDDAGPTRLRDIPPRSRG